MPGKRTRTSEAGAQPRGERGRREARAQPQPHLPLLKMMNLTMTTTIYDMKHLSLENRGL